MAPMLLAALLAAASLPVAAAGPAPPSTGARPPARPAPAPASPQPAPATEPDASDGFERSIIRIVNFSQRGDWSTPWEISGVHTSSGSGFVIPGGLILTNAHVVSDSRLLLLYVHGDPTPHKARAVVLGHDCDLALVRPEEPGLLDGLPALELGGLPPLRSTVETYGYPAGGDQISSTRGVVSRVEINVYTHSGVDQHITVQTDAAINPGNSGGPVVQGGRVVGVAFQGASDLENTGYAIPVEVVRHFLDDAKDARYDGYPDLAIQDSNLLNPAARRRAGLADGESGVRVDFISPGGSAEGMLEPGDVLLAVDGRPIANDGSILEAGLRFDFGLLVDRHQIGETVSVRVLRKGERRTIDIPLKAHPDVALHTNAYDRLPRYFIYAGLVFVPLENEMLKTYGREWIAAADRRLIYEHLYRPLIDPPPAGYEPVVLLRRLDHPVNIDIAWYRNQLVTAVNGRAIRGLADLIEAIESSTDRWLVLTLGEPGRFIVLDRAAAAEAGPEILRQYGVQKDRNP
jgi:S1-C subfamily serine protease